MLPPAAVVPARQLSMPESQNSVCIPAALQHWVLLWPNLIEHLWEVLFRNVGREQQACSMEALSFVQRANIFNDTAPVSIE